MNGPGTMRSGRILAVALVAFGILGALAGPASAASKPESDCPKGNPPEYPAGRCVLFVDDYEIQPGDTVNVRGCGYKPGSTVSLRFVPEGRGKIYNVTNLVADDVGCITGTVTAPTNIQPGQYRIRALGKAPNNATFERVSDIITVTQGSAQVALDGADAASSDTLPSYGLALPVSLAFLVVGSLFVRRSRRSRPTA